MDTYANLSGDSGVAEFAILVDCIKVRFNHSRDVYVYTDRSVGTDSLAEMIRRANAGKGLATYIAQNVRESYDRIE